MGLLCLVTLITCKQFHAVHEKEKDLKNKSRYLFKMPPVLSTKKQQHFRCSLPTCSYYAPKGFYGFPKNEKLRKRWQDLCGMEEVKKCDRLCFQHFEESQIMAKNSDEQPRLKLGGVPSLNLPKVRNKTLL